jgi:NTE family protein
MDHASRAKPCLGLILSGGGARAAYQVGVLKAIAELLPPDSPNPFPVICGTSAGAINAAALAIYAGRFRGAVRRLDYVWRNFHAGQVYRADAWGVLRTGLHWLAALLLGGLGRRNPRALLDRSPLRRLLEQYLPCDKIQAAIDAGVLRALSVTCSGYLSGDSVSFYQGVATIRPWRRVRRVGCPARITIDHLMASSAIPFLFAAERIHREYFGDGTMRQSAPLSPALHLGAERLLVIGVRHAQEGRSSARAAGEDYPSLAQIAGHVLDSIFLDSLDADLERLERINKTLSLIPAERQQEGELRLRPVKALVIAPSEDLAKIAARHAHHLPRPVRYLLRGVGAYDRTGANLVSYLLFERPYTRELIALGYADAMLRRQEIEAFFGIETAETSLAK